MGIRIVLIILLVATTSHLLLRRHSVRTQAGRKLFAVAFCVLAIVTIIVPDTLTGVANMLGVGRGADLLLYLTAIGFVYATLDTRLRISDLDDRIAAVISDLALLRAEVAAAPGTPACPEEPS